MDYPTSLVTQWQRWLNSLFADSIKLGLILTDVETNKVQIRVLVFLLLCSKRQTLLSISAIHQTFYISICIQTLSIQHTTFITLLFDIAGEKLQKILKNVLETSTAKEYKKAEKEFNKYFIPQVNTTYKNMEIWTSEIQKQREN